jgi:hypothetical protein
MSDVTIPELRKHADIWGKASEIATATKPYGSTFGEVYVAPIARAILAERQAAEARMAALLKDPVAVRLNWQRGGINADSIIAEERERCAKIADREAEERQAVAPLLDGKARTVAIGQASVASGIAQAIRSPHE